MKLIAPEGNKTITLSDGEEMNIVLEDFKSGSREFTLNIEMKGKDSICHIRGRTQSFGKDKKKWTVTQIFLGENQTGSIDLHGTAEDSSHLTFDGAAVIESDSSQADAHVEERIILFDEAHGRSLPVLTVKTDDVASAGHAASIAPVEIEKILMLTARGIEPQMAKKMLKKGFLK